jgi:hypothetical protein
MKPQPKTHLAPDAQRISNAPKTTPQSVTDDEPPSYEMADEIDEDTDDPDDDNPDDLSETDSVFGVELGAHELEDPPDIKLAPPPPRIDKHSRFIAETASPYEKLRATGDAMEATSLHELDTIKLLKNIWLQRGLKENDPAFVLIEGIGLIENRNRAVMKATAEMMRHLADMTEELAKTMRQSAPLFAQHQRFLKEWLLSVPQLVATQKELADGAKKMSEAVVECVGMLNDKTTKAVMLRFAQIIGGLLIGVGIGIFFGR